MKILHLINTLSAGGAELHLLTLCRYLKQQGVEVIVTCLREQTKGSRSLRPEFEQEGIKVLNLQADSRYDWRFLSKFIHLLKEEKPDILHTHLPRADFAGFLAKLFFNSIRWICSIHDIYSKSWSGRWFLPMFNFVWRHADALIAISHAVEDWLIQERRIPSEKITVIHYGIEVERFAQPNFDFQKAQGLTTHKVIGSIGRLEPRKGHDVLIRAMPNVLKQIPNGILIIAGHDPWGYGSILHSMIDKLGLNNQVRLLGFQADIPSFLHALDVFAFASSSEGFGQVLIEAMAAGKPVVASRIAPITEIVVDGETGILVKPESPEDFAQAISYLLSHPEKGQAMGLRGSMLVEKNFSVQRMVKETLQVYENIIDS